ncbi:TolC family protein [Mitsuaria sp. GD03876]|uniref:TolC family protein n=1 Tax=Mitsuaria sp. GD03876 TaxID=2975399 RepID=UPI002448E49F|nr:TolC family protein [Mitsuaria sp. GD03876]
MSARRRWPGARTVPPLVAAALAFGGARVAWALPPGPGPDDCAGGAPASTQPLELDDVTRLALCHSAELAIAQAQVRHQDAQLAVARSSLYPQVTASASRVVDRTDYAGPEAGTRLRSTSLSGAISWRLYDFGARAHAVAVERLGLRAVEADAVDARDKAIQAAASAFFDRQRAEATSVLRHQEVALAQGTLESVQRKAGSGAASDFEVRQAQAFVGRTRLEERAAGATLTKARSALASLVGRDGPFEIAAAPPDAQDAWIPSAEELVREVLAANAAVQAAQAQLDASRERVRQARAETLPTVDAGLDYYRNGRPTVGLSSVRATERVASIAVNIPLFDGFRGSALKDQAAALVQQRIAELEKARERALLDATLIHEDALAARDSLGIATATVSTAEEAFASAQRRFAHGVGDLSELIGAETALVNAREARIDALTSLAVATAQLRIATARTAWRSPVATQ